MRDDVESGIRATRPLRIRLLALSTGDMLVQELSECLRSLDLDAEVSHPGFGIVIPELLSAPRHAVDCHVILMDERGLFVRDWRQPSTVALSLLNDRVEALVTAVEGFAATAGGPIIINTLPAAAAPQAGLLDLTHPDGAAQLIDRVNRRLLEMAVLYPRVVLIDTDMAMAHIAATKRCDPKLWFYARLPYSAAATRALALTIAHVLDAPRHPPVKVLALDLDDTLWRGIYGELGIAHLECGDDFPGNAFKAVQEECLRLKSQGYLLAILSKNDVEVLRVFDEHPGMALKRDDFVASRINWLPKADNIRELAAELNLGLDSFLFLDDSVHEREAMRRLAPEVRVPELPSDAAQRPAFLRAQMLLWPQSLTSEDRNRTELYTLRLKGRPAQRQAQNIDDYLASLDQRLIVELVTPATVPRIAQMHARTNQFNLTTLRLTEADLSERLANPNMYQVFQGRVTDHFGDHGIVICAVLRLIEGHAVIETLLMSCRVIGRDVETAFIGELLQRVNSTGATDIVEGAYIPTKKNGPASSFFQRSGFSAGPPNAADGQVWQWRRGVDMLPISRFVAVERLPGGENGGTSPSG